MNIKMTAGRLAPALLFVLLLVAAAQPAHARLSVFVSILPQSYLIQRIGGELLSVSVLVGPGQSPHAYEPTPRQVAALSGADIYFTIGLPFEQRLIEKAGVARRISVIDMRRGIELRNADDHDEDGHGGPEGKDPHIWLAPQLLKRQAETACRALQKKDEGNAAAYQKNFDILAAELDALDKELARRLAPFAGRELFVFHPALGYYADAYRLRQVAIEMAGKEPGSKSFAAVLDRARTSGVKTIFVEKQFSPKSALAVAGQIGAEVVAIDPLAPDCFQTLRDITGKIEKMK